MFRNMGCGPAPGMKQNSGRIGRVRRHSAISDDQSGHSACESAVEPRSNSAARARHPMNPNLKGRMSWRAGKPNNLRQSFIPPIGEKRIPKVVGG